MGTKRAKDTTDLSTLALAKAIVEGNASEAQVAIDAGADLQAYWLDGTTTLRELALERGVSVGAKSKSKNPQINRRSPKADSVEDFADWDAQALVFVVQRGYAFEGETNPLSRSQLGSPIRQIHSAKAALRLLQKKGKYIERVSGGAVHSNDKQSEFTVDFGAQWNGDRRIVGFTLKFKVDAPNEDLWAAFKAAKREGRHFDPPHPAEAVLNAQMDWEGRVLAREFAYSGCTNLDDTIKCLRKGGNPFFEEEDFKLGDGGSEEDAAFMNALREELGPLPGWHRRISEFLTPKGIEAIKAKAVLAMAAPKPKPRKAAKKSASPSKSM
jgi:hypothetical protein